MGGLHVINPAMQQGACLPPPPCVGAILKHIAHLVFDPAESPHYEVFLVPDNPDREEQLNKCRQVNHAPSAIIVSGQTPFSSAIEDRKERDDSLPLDRSMEWPASTWVLCVFSSRTGCWEERAFSREGKAVGNVADMPSREYSSWRGYAVYWRDAIYVHCNEGESIIRIALSNDKYRVIELPSAIEWTEHCDFHLGRSEKGLSLASFHDWYNLWVWVLDESHDQIEWVLRHQIDMEPVLCVLDYGEQTEGPWILQDVSNDEDDSNPAVKEKNFEWDSDNDDVINVDYEAAQRHHGEITVLGFHPYKVVVFLNVATRKAVAYHLNSSMVQDLGNLFPKDYDAVAGIFAEILMSFLYTPCLMEFLENNLEGHDQD